MKKLPLFVALDLDDEKTALDCARKFSPYVLGFKVGPRLYFRSRSSLIENLSQWGEVFLDFKFYDIPSTMVASVRACFKRGAKYLTIHAESGPEALSCVAQVEKDFKDCKVLAVTILTSQSKTSSLLNQVLDLAQRVNQSGLSGLVASSEEVYFLRKKYPDFFIIVPGIRLSPIENDDQKRTATPAEAFSHGASALVMGRSILKAEDPLRIFQTISNSLLK